MEVIFILLPLAILIAGVMLALFIWAVRSGQYDDLETPAHRILFDDEDDHRINSHVDCQIDDAVEAESEPPEPSA